MKALAIVGWLAAGLLVSLVAWNFPARSRAGHTCAVCRLTRLDSTFLGLAWSSYHPTECSRWYAEHVEPTHVHLWEQVGCERIMNLFGTRMGFACAPGRHPIQQLPADTQMRIYQHFKDPFEAKRLFEGLTDAKTRDRIDEDDLDRGHLMVEALWMWDAQGFPGTWDEWRDRTKATAE